MTGPGGTGAGPPGTGAGPPGTGADLRGTGADLRGKGADLRGAGADLGGDLGRTGADEDPRGDLRWQSVPGLLADAARRFGDDEALVGDGASLTFAELADRALAVTAAAVGAGVRHGDRVAIWAPNSPAWVVAALGMSGAGAVLVPVNTRFKGDEAADVLRRSGVHLLLTVDELLGVAYPEMLEGRELPDLERIVLLPDGMPAGPAQGRCSPAPSGEVTTATDVVPVYGWAELLAAADGVVEADGDVVGRPVTADDARARWARVAPTDPSDIVFTSGTTGRPKGAVATHAQTLRAFATWASVVGLRRGDRYLVVNPFFHTFGLKAGVLACLMAGAAIVPHAVFDVDRVLDRVERERISVLPGPPTLYQSILDHPGRPGRDLSSLRLAVTGAATVPVVLVERMRDELSFDTVLTAYGLTEACGVVTMCRRGDDATTVATTSGRAIPGVEVRVVDPSGADVPAGQPGEVLVGGYPVVRDYVADPDAVAGAVDDDGWLHTGDVGVLDGAGNLRITDRIKDIVVVGGFNVSPAEVEACLLRHPAVSQAAVVGRADRRLGEVPWAFVVPRPGCEVGPGELVDHARRHLANYKVPRGVDPVDALPVGAGGKVAKTELRRMLAQRDTASPAGTEER